MDTLKNLLRHFENQPQQDKNNTIEEVNHNRLAQPVPVIETPKAYVESAMHSDNLSETDNESTVDAKQKSPAVTDRRENNNSEWTL